MTAWLIDSNVFIQARNLHYGFDFCPAFRDWLVEQNRIGNVASIGKAADELKEGNDELAAWAAARDDGFFLPPDNAVLQSLVTVGDWANGRGYSTGAVNTFLDGADCWLIAHALAHACIVVTHERRSDTTGKIRIPNACTDLDLPCMNPCEMLRREGASFVLASGGVVV